MDKRERGLRKKKGNEMSQTPQSLTELFSRYLHRQIVAQAEGLGLSDPDGQVVPHEAVPMQPVARDLCQYAEQGRATVENWAALGADRALTGPVVRGDEATIEAQRAAVVARTPELTGLFDALVETTRALAREPQPAWHWSAMRRSLPTGAGGGGGN